MKRHSFVRHAVFINLLFTPALLGQVASGGFASQVVISTAADRPRDVYAADLNGNGLLDVLSVSITDGKVAWYPNLGGGSFGAQQVISTSANQPTSVYATDLDGDGDIDVLSAANDDTINWYENLGNGTFGGQQIITSAVADPSAVYAADLDGDGDADVLSAGLSDSTIAWCQNLGGGTFGAPQIITVIASAATDVYAKDLDGDGDLDVLSAGFGFGSQPVDKVAWYENLGGGTFGPQQVIATDSNFYTCVLAADFDGDGDADVLTASRDDSELAWHENLGAGSFGPQQIISTEIVAVRYVDVADFDLDGDQDVVALGSGAWNKLGWFENLGGSFGPLQPILPGSSSQIISGSAVLAADLDSDGFPDVLTASQSDDKISLYVNMPFVTSFGQGCGLARLNLAPTSTASTSAPITATVTHGNGLLTVIALGLSRDTMPGLGALPFDLGAIGMTGCTLYQSSEVFGLSTQPSPTPQQADWTAPALPAGSLGMQFFGQAFAFAPNANALGVLSSNAVAWTVVQ